MSVAKRGQREPRRAPPDEKPTTLIDLVWGLTGDPKRARILIVMITCIVLVFCIPVCIGLDAMVLAAKGIKGLTLAILIPNSLLGTGWLTCFFIWVKKMIKNRRRGAATDARNTTRRSPEPNHKQGRRQLKQKPAQRTRQRYEQSRQPQGSRQSPQTSPPRRRRRSS